MRAFMRWVGWTLRVVFERVDDLVRVAHGPAGGVAQFVELLLVFVFVGGMPSVSAWSMRRIR